MQLECWMDEQEIYQL